ncbi:hypothetical protein DAETH_37280 (plasmid) [Deinococcus aetherius]|uniref:Lipoprotein n=1 Tax=Deinococcus aetherius TaxID=200252 RepID=A0ABM8AIW3_9DEIO|nr:hypothetical protein [Deinococcus aetherius]BDP43759.1 hypothetical protein DAETH_37280 [Deinococcus aetherius]
MKFTQLLPCLLLLTSCSAGARNTPDAALFERVVKGDKAAIQPICLTVFSPVEDLPTKFQLSAEKESYFQRFKVLQKHGYVEIKRGKATDPFTGAQVDAWAVSLTPKWTRDFQTPYSGVRCIATWKAQRVKDFTPPAEVNGVRVAYVAVTGTQQYLGWARNAELRQVFRLPDLKPSTERTYTLVLKNTGWQVAAVGP